MQPQPRRYTPEEYFALDEAAPEGVRLEYFDGFIYHKGQIYDPSNPELASAMAGGTPEHARISTNASRLIGNQLPDCHVAGSDQKVQLADSYVYPDVVVSCEPEYDGDRLVTPQLIVEVLSTSTAVDDTGRKLRAYTQLGSLVEYWVVEQREVGVTRYYRTGEDSWGMQGYADLDAAITSEPLGLDVSLRELYRTVF